MKLEFEIPGGVQESLEAAWGNLPQAAKEALAIESYRTGRISLGLLAEMLGMGVIEADQWLADRGVPIPCTSTDLAQDRDDLRQLFPEFVR